MSNASNRRRRQKVKASKGNANSNIQKDSRQQRESNKTLASPAIQAVKQIVELLKPYELSATQRFKTYQIMLGDEAVWSALESRMTSIETAQHRHRLKFDKNSERSVWLKDFIEYNIRTMKRTPRAVAAEKAEMIFNGLAPHEIVTRVEKDYTEYVGHFVLDDLVYIDPLTIDANRPIETADGGRNIKYWRQRRDAFKDTNGTYSKDSLNMDGRGVKQIDSRKVSVSSYAASSSRPLGRSSLDAAYSPWREKVLIQDYLVMGIQKDLAGTPVLEVPAELLSKAAADPNGDEAKTIAQLQIQMGNLHAGDQGFMILPSDPFENASGNTRMYNAKFLGIEGGGKSFNLVEIIEQKKTAIFNVLGASHLITGESGGGSYNLHEGKANVQAHYSKRDNIIIDDCWNKDISPYILKMNNLTNEKISDIPVYEHGEVQPLSADEEGKYIMRTQRFLPLVPEVVNKILSTIGVHDYTVPADATREELLEICALSGVGINNGESEGSSGTGNTQTEVSNSDNNGENAA